MTSSLHIAALLAAGIGMPAHPPRLVSLTVSTAAVQVLLWTVSLDTSRPERQASTVQHVVFDLSAIYLLVHLAVHFRKTYHCFRLL